MYVHHDATKHGCVHRNAVKRAWIHLKKLRLTIHAPRFIVDCTFEDAPVCDAASRVAATMVSKLRVPLLLTSSNCSCKHFLSCKQLQFLT
ncbi:hypothetical protein TNCV_4312711 [Trichonephila clavipes]|nr:hypothetical protein TNCV_4312711 [Trichonephila clavipes]